MNRTVKLVLMAGMILLPGCLVVTCGSSDLEQREVPAETDGGDF